MFRQILHVSVCVWKRGSRPDPRQVGMCVCSAVWESVCVTVHRPTRIHASTAKLCVCVYVCVCVCVCVSVKGGGTALGGLDGAGAEVEGMWWVREEPRQSQACYL